MHNYRHFCFINFIQIFNVFRVFFSSIYQNSQSFSFSLKIQCTSDEHYRRTNKMSAKFFSNYSSRSLLSWTPTNNKNYNFFQISLVISLLLRCIPDKLGGVGLVSRIFLFSVNLLFLAKYTVNFISFLKKFHDFESFIFFFYYYYFFFFFFFFNM